MIKKLTVLSLLLMTASLANSSSFAYAGMPGGNPGSQSYLAQFAAIINDVLWADNEMEKQMRVVSQKLDRFYFTHGHFPQTEDEQNRFRSILARYIIGNPYQPREIDLVSGQQVQQVQQALPQQQGASKQQGYALTIYFLSDTGLSEENIETWVHSPPPTWQGPPGSIFVMTNGSNLYLIWSAGVDCLPIKDLEHGNVMRVISHCCHRTTQDGGQ